ncbi:hypothetical protein MMC31_004531 [Peltigera leucophlebia]|nr:hypothetical protein [Peltigera leucophlebia]
MPPRREKRSKKATQEFFSASSSSSVPEPQSSSTPALVAITPREKACLVFKAMTTNLEERILAEEADTDLARDRADLGKSFPVGDFQDENEHIEKVEEGLEIAHDVKAMMLQIKRNKDEGLDVQIYERTDKVASASQKMQLFNLEKRFGFFREDTRGIIAQAESWSGRKLEREPRSLRQLFNDPMALIEKDSPTETQKPADLVAALSDFRRLSKLALQDVQAFNQIFACEEAKLPGPPTTAPYGGCRLPDIVPERIRKSAWDLQLIKEDMVNLRDRLVPLRERVRDAMIIWMTASSAVWKYGAAHVHEFQSMREYEYLRTSIQAANLLGQREDNNILSYFLSDASSQGVCPELQTKLSQGGRDLAKSNKDWEDRKETLTGCFLPVDEMVKRLSRLIEG